MYCRNGDIYAGEYFADKMHGFGVYQFQNGHRYEGAWHEGRRQGLGMYTFRNGETQCGHWQNGILDDPKRHNSPTGSPCDVDHAKVSNAVQVMLYFALMMELDVCITLYQEHCRLEKKGNKGL